MFYIFSKEKIYTYIVSIMIVLLLLVVAGNENFNIVNNSNITETKAVSEDRVYNNYINNYINNLTNNMD